MRTRQTRRTVRTPRNHAFSASAWMTASALVFFFAPHYLDLAVIPTIIFEAVAWIVLISSLIKSSAELCNALNLRSHMSIVTGAMVFVSSAILHKLTEYVVSAGTAFVVIRSLILFLILTGSAFLTNGISLLMEPKSAQKTRSESAQIHKCIESTKLAVKIFAFSIIVIINIFLIFTRVIFYISHGS